MAVFGTDRKSTRLNSSHLVISYAVFCLKKKKKKNRRDNCLQSRGASNAKGGNQDERGTARHAPDTGLFSRDTGARPRTACLFFFNDTATTEIYTLSLHDALPISRYLGAATRNAVVAPIRREISAT